jgi:hypothetical protein
VSELDDVYDPLRVGDPITAKKLSALILGPLPPLSMDGRETRLPPGLAKFPLFTVSVGGSISKEDRNEVDSRSCLVLVMVRNESRILFCSALGVPFRSRIFPRHISSSWIFQTRRETGFTFWKLEKEASPIRRV